jgi:hypothetical protein
MLNEEYLNILDLPHLGHLQRRILISLVIKLFQNYKFNKKIAVLPKVYEF